MTTMTQVPALPPATGRAGRRSSIGVPVARIVTPWCRAGRNPLDQLIDPPGGSWRASGMTTNAGRSSPSLPSP